MVAFLVVVLCELKDLPVSLVREYRYVIANREGMMNESIGSSSVADQNVSMEQVNQSQAPWWQAFLAGLPHLLYPLSIKGPGLLSVITSEPVKWSLAYNSFWILVIIALLFSWRRKWPRWSASWVGYGSVMLFDILIDTAQTYYGSLLENEAVLLWLVITMAVFFWMAKRDWLNGLLVVLPVAPMFYTYIGLDGVKGTVPESVYFIIVGLLMMLIVMAIVRTGNLRAAIWLVLGAAGLIGLPVSYMTTYYSNIPAYIEYEPTVSEMVRSYFISVLIFVIFAMPLWSLALWTKGRRWFGRNKAA
jgi:hypothetical protein